MHQQHDPAQYPHGRGYGHDYMRGGEVLGGYGYSMRDEYALPLGELQQHASDARGDDESRGEAEAPPG